jgi:hypothetical protein
MAGLDCTHILNTPMPTGGKSSCQAVENGRICAAAVSQKKKRHQYIKDSQYFMLGLHLSELVEVKLKVIVHAAIDRALSTSRIA